MKYFFTSLLLLLPLTVSAQDSSTLDSDFDGLSDFDETSIFGTDPLNPDTDADGYSDGEEISNGFSPLAADMTLRQMDSDNDHASDAWELALGTSHFNSDTDNDGFLDGVEIMNGYSPLSPAPEKIVKRIEVDLATQYLKYFFGPTELDAFYISSGLARTPTPPGDYTVLKKIPVKRYVGADYDLPNTKWNLHFTTRRLGYYIHGAYWHDNFGNPMSHGCVNVSYDDMEALYAFANEGTPISIR